MISIDFAYHRTFNLLLEGHTSTMGPPHDLQDVMDRLSWCTLGPFSLAYAFIVGCCASSEGLAMCDFTIPRREHQENTLKQDFHDMLCLGKPSTCQ